MNNPSNPTPSDGKLIGDESIAYDKIGNITTLRRVKTATNMNLGFTVDEFIYQYANGNNRLMMADGINGAADRNYTYDANGNLLTDDSKTISATQYIRGSYANQITKTGGDQITYQYDAADLRHYKKVVASGVTTEEMYVKDALGRDLAVVKWVGNGTPETEFYVHGTNRIAMIISDGSTAHVTPSEATFFLYDHLGNTRVAFKSAGSQSTIVNAMDYYPYGKILREFDNGIINGNRYLTTAHERDGETGLDYRGARYYDSDVARFLSTDPWANKYPQWSTYNYVMGNPVNLIDPTGKGADNPPYKKDQGAGGSTLTLPAGAQILNRYEDKNDDGKISFDGGKTVLDAKAGDVWRFSVNGTTYAANYRNGKFNGYWDANGSKFKGEVSINSSSNKSNNVSNLLAGLNIPKIHKTDPIVGYYIEYSQSSLFSGGASVGTLHTKYHGTHSYTTDASYNQGFQFKTELFSAGGSYGYILSTGPASEVPLSAIEGFSKTVELNASAVLADIGAKVGWSSVPYNNNGDILIYIGNQASVGVGTPFLSFGYTQGNTIIDK